MAVEKRSLSRVATKQEWFKPQLYLYNITVVNLTLYAHHREFREHVKDLSSISKDLCRIVIVDNNPFSFLLQPLNGIPCIPFSPGQPDDEQLLEVILPLLKHLSEQKDVRPMLHERFQMPEWFQNHGIPAYRFME
uniref:Mitochondrial import inner membrane translocase subunit TIM50 n=1 Tax=Nicotiana sylvestris TaxID=4096 RepID=A0A1U7VJP0_NICSY|nr:PREDICTED: mitochondrial import inner membrane translocase subunit TIM50-like [Nicotiana sylvestris]